MLLPMVSHWCWVSLTRVRHSLLTTGWCGDKARHCKDEWIHGLLLEEDFKRLGDAMIVSCDYSRRQGGRFPSTKAAARDDPNKNSGCA